MLFEWKNGALVSSPCQGISSEEEEGHPVSVLLPLPSPVKKRRDENSQVLLGTEKSQKGWVLLVKITGK